MRLIVVGRDGSTITKSLPRLEVIVEQQSFLGKENIGADLVHSTDNANASRVPCRVPRAVSARQWAYHK
jgi:hypothetical protein